MSKILRQRKGWRREDINDEKSQGKLLSIRMRWMKYTFGYESTYLVLFRLFHIQLTLFDYLANLYFIFSLSVPDSCKVPGKKKVECIDWDAGIPASKFHMIRKYCERFYPFALIFFKATSSKINAESKERGRSLRTGKHEILV